MMLHEDFMIRHCSYEELKTHVLKLKKAIQQGDLDRLRALLILQENDQDGRRFAIKDKDIYKALYFAAGKGRVAVAGRVVACRLLWERLSPKRKRRAIFAATTSNNRCGLLHTAAFHGCLQVVQLFVEEFNFNVNQKNHHGATPLQYFGLYQWSYEPIIRLLLEHGADPNQGLPLEHSYKSPLYRAVESNFTDITRLLLQYKADPNFNHTNRPAASNEVIAEDDSRQQQEPARSIVDHAIKHGNIEILTMLLQHGALVGSYYYCNPDGSTCLNDLLLCRISPRDSLIYRNGRTTRDTKLAICRILVNHSQVDIDATAAFLQVSLESAVKEANNDAGGESCRILLEAGVTPTSRALCCAIQVGNEAACRLLVQYGADPFVEEGDDDNGNNDNNDARSSPPPSPFHVAARRQDTGILVYLLELWDQRFPSRGGMNEEGDYPLHVICRESHVSLQAVILVFGRYESDVLTALDASDHPAGLTPVLIAAKWDASVDVIDYLLGQCPVALLQLLNL